MMLVAPDTRLERIDFGLVPERAVGDLDEVIATIQKNLELRSQDKSVPSWGAVVFRNAPDLSPSELVEAISPDGKHRTQDFNNRGGYLHIDDVFNVRNSSVTVQKTNAGQSHGVIMVGGERSEAFRELWDRKKLHKTRQLIHHHLLDQVLPVLSEVGEPLEVYLQPGDVFVFDHGQPHALAGSWGRRAVSAF